MQPTYTPGVTHTIVAGARMETSTQLGCCRIRVLATAPCFIRITKDGDPATDDDLPLVPMLPEYLTISHGGVKVSVAGAGTVYVTEIS
jgi:hypothetical protein